MQTLVYMCLSMFICSAAFPSCPQLGDYPKAVAAYRHVIAADSVADGGRPSAAELQMARTRLKEAEAALRASRLNVELLAPSATADSENAPPMALSTFATQLEELMEELFSESATLYAEHGVELGEGIREMVRHVRARRLVAAGQVCVVVQDGIPRLPLISYSCGRISHPQHHHRRTGCPRSWHTSPI